MEILIVGGALVALMVYVSTKIKKSAESAYERETIETEKFFIVKPENFINPLNRKSEFAFTAHSKDFGKDAAEEIRQAQVDLRVYSNADFDKVCQNAKSPDGEFISEETARIDGNKICFLKLEKTENKIATEVFYKIIESVKRLEIYELKISILSEHKENYSVAINELLESFTVR